MTYYSDENRHLICLPYSIENLHIMAKEFGINRCWFHSCNNPHYDIPKSRIEEITEKTTIISSKCLLKIIKNN